MDALYLIFPMFFFLCIGCSDNGLSFTSTEFQKFVKANGINHVLTALYQPQANELAKRMVQTFKNSMKKCTNGNITSKLN